MKKLFIFLFTLGTFTTVIAQQGRYDHEKYCGNNRSNSKPMHNDRYSQQSGYDYAYQGSNRNSRYDERERRQQIERLNRDYDRRINGYRNDRSMNRYERERMIARAERERKEKVRSFAGGAVIGAAAGLLLGVLIGSN